MNKRNLNQINDDLGFNAKCDGIRVAKDFCNGVNSMTYQKEFVTGFVEEITTREHRTLQQGVMRSLYELIKAWAEMGKKQGYYDARNEATVHFCQNIKALAEKDNVHFPFI